VRGCAGARAAEGAAVELVGGEEAKREGWGAASTEVTIELEGARRAPRRRAWPAGWRDRETELGSDATVDRRASCQWQW
jgi:hypothetical protein